VGATVYLKSDSSKSITTDINGSFTLQGDWIVAGTYTLVAEKGSFSLEFTVTVEEDGQTTESGSQEVSPTDPGATIPDLGVIKGSYDRIENIITDLGYGYTTLEVADLDNYLYISTFEAIFINCGYTGDYLTTSRETNLQNFVETAGGSLYVSDWAADYIQAIWPTAINWYGGSVNAAKQGAEQTLEATVVDTILQTLLGKSTADIYYDLGSWVIISSEGTGTDVLLSGNPGVSQVFSVNTPDLDLRVDRVRTFSEGIAGTLEAVPLAVKFQPGGASKGTIIYTTFHNEAQEEAVTEDARRILEEFIFRL